MSEIRLPLMHDVLRECANADPNPWLPKQSSHSWEEIKPAIERLWQDGHLVRVKTDHPDDIAFTISDSGFHLYQNPADWEQYRENVEQELNDPRLQARRKVIRDVLSQPPHAVVSRWILWLNILIFLYGLYLCSEMNASYKDFCIGFGRNGLQPIYEKIGVLRITHVIQEKWVRLLTACFVHFGLIHLFFNGYALYVLGKRGEQSWGWWRFLLIYLIAGVGGSCASIYSSPDANPRAGASGAICGLLGAELIWLLGNRPYLPRKWFSQKLTGVLFFAGIIAVLGMVMGDLAGPGVKVDNAGHLGGGIVGAVVATFLHWQRFNRFIIVRGLALLLALSVPALCVLGMKQSIEGNATFKAQVRKVEKTSWVDYRREAHQIKEELKLFCYNPKADNDPEKFDLEDLLRKGGPERDQQKVNEAIRQIDVRLTQIRAFQKKLADLGELKTKKWKVERAQTAEHFDGWIALLTRIRVRLQRQQNLRRDEGDFWMDITEAPRP